MTRFPNARKRREAPLGRLPGMLRDFAPRRPVTVEEMDEAMLRTVAEKYKDLTGSNSSQDPKD